MHVAQKDDQYALEGQRDPSAFVQQLTDAEGIGTFCDPLVEPSVEELAERQLHSRTLVGSENQMKLTNWHATLDQQVLYAKTALLNGDLTVLDSVADRLGRCLLDLHKSQPKGGVAQWQHVNQIVSSGCAYPSQNQDVPCDAAYNTWLAILDRLENPSFSQLLYHILEVIVEVYDIAGKAASSGTMTTRSFFAPWDFICRIIEGLLPVKLPLKKSVSVIVWFKKTFLHQWDGETRVIRGTIPFISLTLLQCIYELSTSYATSDDSAQEIMNINAVVGRMDAIDLAQSWIDGPREHHLLSFNFLFTLNQQVTYLRTINHLRMRKVVTEGKQALEMQRQNAERSFETLPRTSSQLKYLEETYFLLSVSRGNVLQDTFDQLWQRRGSELLRPLRVRLGEMDTFEVGHDLGGVQIEFFNLVCKELFSESLRKFAQSTHDVTKCH